MPISGGGSGSGLSAIPDKDLLANTSGASAVPVGTTVSTILDSALGSTRGATLFRGASGWAILAPGTSGYALVSGGAGADPSYSAVSTSPAVIWDYFNAQRGWDVLQSGVIAHKNLATTNMVRANTSHTTGKWYFELKYLDQNAAVEGDFIGGIADASTTLYGTAGTAYPGGVAKGYGYADNTHTYANGTGTWDGSGDNGALNDVYGFAFDGDGHTLKVYRNNVLKQTCSGIEASAFYPAIGAYNINVVVALHATSSQLTYTPPTGYTVWG